MKAPIDDFVMLDYAKGDVTQWYAENPVLYGTIGLAGHNGIDIVAPHGSPMYAVEGGTVVDVKDTPDGYGRHLRIITHGEYGDICREWTYGHCDKILVSQNDVVKEGQLIANMGNTGFVVSGKTPYWEYNPFAGTHLHLGVRQVKRVRLNGWSYPNNSILIQTLNYGNGYKGSIDPRPFLQSISNEDAERTRLLTIISMLNKVVELYKQLNLLKK